MNVFTDYHHGDLYHSFHLLFEKRLGWELYRPIGKDWFDGNWWQYSSNPDTIEQYLGLNQAEREEDGIYYCPDINHKTIHKAITLNKFLDMKIDIIIASVWNHERSFYELSKLKTGAKFIRQLGNVADIFDPSITKNIMSSNAPHSVPSEINTIFYHQEFDTNIFSHKRPGTQKRITSLMNCIPHSVDFPLWYSYKNELADYEWKMHGILGTDGVVDGLENIAKTIQGSTFIWHLKSQGDGFGHIIHNSYACGRPCIVKGGYYADRLAESLFVDNVTCIDLDKGTMQENIKRIRSLSRPWKHRKMCQEAYARFRNVVDFDEEFLNIKEFLAKLL